MEKLIQGINPGAGISTGAFPSGAAGVVSFIKSVMRLMPRGFAGLPVDTESRSGNIKRDRS